MTGNDIRARAERWYVAQCHPRHEWIAKMNIGGQGFGTFLPTFTTRRAMGRRVANLVEPLFAGYLFVRFDRNDGGWRAINGTRGVLRVLCGNGRNDRLAEDPLPLPRGCVEELQAKANADGLIHEDEAPESLRYEAGTWMHVIDGPFAGHAGTCAEAYDGRASRVFLLLRLLGREAVVQLPLSQLSVAR